MANLIILFFFSVISATFLPRVKPSSEKSNEDTNTSLENKMTEMEERLRDNITEIKEMLRKLSSQIGALNVQLVDIQNSCSEPPAIENAYPKIRDRKHGAVVLYACVAGRTLEGSGELVCRFGQWTGVLPQCLKSNCSDPPAIENGFPQFNDRQHGAVVAYACEVGRTLLGNGELVCRLGEWSGVLPHCVKNCNTQDLSDYVGLDLPWNTTVEHSETLDVRCHQGYVISNSSEYLTCNDGSWNVTDDPCMRGTCSEPPAIENGYPKLGNREHGAVVSYACEAGRTLFGNGELVCRLGEWSGVLPHCVKNCNTQDLSQYDGLVLPRKTTVEHSKTLPLRCHQGYIISNTSESLTCKDGSWNVIDDPCVRDSCSEPPAIENGYPKMDDREHGAVVAYACEGGRTLFGNGELVCRLGQWSGVLPQCVNNCNTQDLSDYVGLDLPWNTTVEHSETLDVRCHQGYVISNTSEYLTCNDGSWNVTDDPCTRGDFDATFHAVASYFGVRPFECFSDSNAGKIRFSRAVDTGTGGSLPKTAQLSTSKKSAKIGFSAVYWPEWIGAYRCRFSEEEGSPDIVVSYQAGDLYFPVPSEMASVGDNITLRLVSTKSRRILWRHDGRNVPSWDGRKEVSLQEVKVEDAGIYTARYEGEAVDWANARLVVRTCKANLYGKQCDQVCPPCYNGGVCHDLLGLCICPDGFLGRNCEAPCPEGFHGAKCSTACEDQNCWYQRHCKPVPYGCPCARGFTGYLCEGKCESGWYGADCRQPCHCADGPQSCNRFTGECSEGCAPGWKGQTCQIKDAEWRDETTVADSP